ncbi:hypothetical protein AB0J82_36815 [Asanoa sp. NPDC049518]|uniref:hypothetical protein n=1 Tax=unclassified Asanoa TaxID=2685164 RepID=UPI00343D992D
MTWLALPHRPTVEDLLLGAVQEPLTPATLVLVAALGVGLLWCALVGRLVFELTFRRARPGRMARLRLPTPVQAATGGVLGAYAVTAATTPAAGHPVDATQVYPDDADRPPGGAAAPPAASSSPTGIDLADGSWLPTPITDAVTAAAATVWFRRRRDYHPDPHGTRRNNGLDPLPRTVDAIQALTDHDEPADSVDGLPPGRLVIPNDLPPAGIGLTGDGADAAARGLLVALLLNHPQPTATRVLTTTGTLDRILPARNPSTTIPGLREAGSIEDAIAALHANGPTPLTLIALTPDPSQQPALADAVAATNATAIMLGGWPSDPVWNVDPSGHIAQRPTLTAQGPQRLCVLTPGAAADLLELLQLTAQIPDLNRKAPLGGAIPVARGPGIRSTPSRIRLVTLGPPAVERDGVEVKVRRSAAWQVLLYLAVHPAGATSHQLATAIWPAERPNTTIGRLYTTVSALRRSLTAAGADQVVEHDGDHYQLDPAVDVDLWELERAATTARHALNDQARHDALTAVTAHYRGELAAGRRWPWLIAHRERIRRTVIDAYVALAADADPPTAARLIEEASQVDSVNAYVRDLVLHGPELR